MTEQVTGKGDNMITQKDVFVIENLPMLKTFRDGVSVKKAEYRRLLQQRKLTRAEALRCVFLSLIIGEKPVKGAGKSLQFGDRSMVYYLAYSFVKILGLYTEALMDQRIYLEKINKMFDKLVMDSTSNLSTFRGMCHRGNIVTDGHYYYINLYKYEEHIEQSSASTVDALFSKMLSTLLYVELQDEEYEVQTFWLDFINGVLQYYKECISKLSS